MEQWRVLRTRRLIMMETKRCPACSRSLSEKPGPDEGDKAAGSKRKQKSSAGSKGKQKSSREEVSDLIEESEKIATEDESMVANAKSVKESKRSRKETEDESISRSVKKSKRSRKEGKKAKRSSDGGLVKKSEDKEDTGSKKKAKRSSETEGSGSKETGSGSKKAEMKDLERGEEEMEDSELMGENVMVTKTYNEWGEEEIEDSELIGENVKTKMVTRTLYKKSIDVLKSRPPIKPFTCDTDDPSLRCTFARDIAEYEVECEFHEYLRRQYVIRGYAEFQQEVTDDEDE